jgi:hypothetical protein
VTSGKLPRDRLAIASQHEAAHGTVASVLGVQVTELMVGAGGNGGRCSCATVPDPATAAVMAAAADLWDSEFSIYEDQDRSCGDLAKAVALVGPPGMWAARTWVRAILTEHRAQVERLAERLAAAPGHELAF